jgi:hypothetical protein
MALLTNYLPLIGEGKMSNSMHQFKDTSSSKIFRLVLDQYFQTYLDAETSLVTKNRDGIPHEQDGLSVILTV